MINNYDEKLEILNGDHEDFVIVEKGAWEHEYKDYYLKSVVVQNKHSLKHYEISASRTGNHNYGFETEVHDMCEVKPVSKVITTWELV
jgi:hypothetical protein